MGKRIERLRNGCAKKTNLNEKNHHVGGDYGAGPGIDPRWSCIGMGSTKHPVRGKGSKKGFKGRS